MNISFNSQQSEILAKASLVSNQSLYSIANILFNRELYCEEFYKEALECLRNLKDQHWDKKCEDCNRASNFGMHSSGMNYSIRNKMDFLSMSQLPDISESRRVYIQCGPDEAPRENDQLDFIVNYKETLENAKILVENLGSQNYEMSFSFEKVNEGFALAWKQIVAKREHAEAICKQVQSLESLELGHAKDWKKLVEAMEEKVFYNSLEKSIEIKAGRNQVDDDDIKGILGSLSDKKSNIYLSLDLSDNPITNDIIPRLYDCLKNWQNKGFSYLLLHLNNTNVDLDFIDILCERMPISLRGLWLDVQHLTIDEKRNTRLLNFLKAHHSYMDFFVIKVKCEKAKEEENQRRIHNIYKIKDRLKLFSVIGSVSEKLKDKVMQSFLNFGGGKLEIEFRDPQMNASSFNKHVPSDSVEMRKGHISDRPNSVSTEFATKEGQKSFERDSSRDLNSFHEQPSVNNKTLNSNFNDSYGIKGIEILSDSQSTEPLVTNLNPQGHDGNEKSIHGLNETIEPQ